MRLPRMTTRPWMIAVAALALMLGGVIGIHELDRRADLFRRDADYHHRRRDALAGEASYLEVLASDPSREAELPFALYKRKRWSRGQAIAMELESPPAPFCRTEAIDRWIWKPPPSARWKQLASEAKRIAIEDARACRRLSEYHARQSRRYERVAFSPWLPLEPDRSSPAP
jgi:hypothetical protein